MMSPLTTRKRAGWEQGRPGRRARKSHVDGKETDGWLEVLGDVTATIINGDCDIDIDEAEDNIRVISDVLGSEQQGSSF
jgi:hypothetical protein